MKSIRVLIIDDSALVRKLLTEILSSDPDIEVVGAVMDPHIARQKIKELNPDVLTLDVEMPRMDGLSFLRQLMRLRPMPVVMISSLTQEGAETTLDALAMGAVDFISKPKVDVANLLQDYAEEIVRKIKNAAAVKVRARVNKPTSTGVARQEAGPAGGALDVDSKYSATAILQRPVNIKVIKTTDKIIAIGASTGGTEAIKEVLEQMPADTPAILIAQHIPSVFSNAFAQRMNRSSSMTVVEASDGQQVMPGHVYIAPGDQHLLLKRDGARYRCSLSDGPPVNRHRPSVDVLFRSVTQAAGKNAIGIILTGMGADGARGLGEMRDAGAITIAQDEKSSVVWGMPGEAVKLGAAQKIVALDQIPAAIMTGLRELQA
ncbi:MAG TPA: chemotaxis response regulator protein-glutamate methylesterase [Gammaproteobacteria bacterium]|nr:chemotaxis response regulator protein-glutamate methylesterase [Gammaproteobacteria bacterium]